MIPLNTSNHPTTNAVPIVAAGTIKSAIVPNVAIKIPRNKNQPHFGRRTSISNSSRFGTIFHLHNHFEAIWVYSPDRLLLTKIHCTDGPQRHSPCRQQIYGQPEPQYDPAFQD